VERADAEGADLSLDEIEVACDVLWFARQHDSLDPEGHVLWDRLQPFRHGDYGGEGPPTTLTPAECASIVAAFGSLTVDLDDDERSLLSRLIA